MFKKLIILLLLLGLLSSGITVFAYVDTDYAINSSGEKQDIPVTYTCNLVYQNFGENVGYLNMPEDLFLDDKGILYIADTGNNRIVRFDPITGKASQITGPDDSPLNAPKGVYVDEHGDLFVADTGNQRVAHLDSLGTLVEEFTKPESALLDSEEVFAPDKIYVNEMNLLYVKQGKQFMIISPTNEFEGYAGAPEVGFDLTQVLINIFASAAQKSRLEIREPAQYSNFLIKDGLIYASSLAESGQLRKISATDKNSYPDKTYGETTVLDNSASTEGVAVKNPQFVDIAVDNNNILYTVDQNSGRIYQYDQEGNLLAVFGGTGSLKGRFESPVSLVVDANGRVYVLDSIQNAVHLFEPTEFIKHVHEAITLYYDGDYEKAAIIWKKVLLTDAEYYMANSGIGNTLYKNEKYKEALSYFHTANDKNGYSKAYGRWLQQIVKTNFLWIVLGLVALLAGIGFLIYQMRRISNHFLEKSYGFSSDQKHRNSY